MRNRLLIGSCLALAVIGSLAIGYGLGGVRAFANIRTEQSPEMYDPPEFIPENGFSIEVLVDGRAVPEYEARGRRYVEALENAEYELRVHNSLGSRVAVAISVDGLNTIDARHTSAWDAHKWVIEPYGTIYIRGWQMSSENARHFYFTTERESYATRLGQTANLGVISAVFFRERQPFVIVPVTPGPARRGDKDAPRRDQRSSSESNSPRESSARTASSGLGAEKRVPYPPHDDESAATGIGRSVRNDVQWIKMDLDSRPVGEVAIRYEYRAALVRLGILPRQYPRPDVIDRRERAQGFEPRYCPQP